MAPIEAISVIFAAVLVWLSALVQNLSNVSERGSQYVMSHRSVSPSLQGFFGRATRTLANNIESALMWVPPVIIILMLHRTSWISQLSAEAYIGARVVFALSYGSKSRSYGRWLGLSAWFAAGPSLCWPSSPSCRPIEKGRDEIESLQN